METLADAEERFQDFFKEEKYRNLLSQMALSEKHSITIDYLDLSDFDQQLAKQMLEKPEKYLEYAANALRYQLRIEDKQYAELIDRVYVRFKGLPEKASLRSIGAHQIEKLTTFDGIIVRATPVHPLLMEAVFICRGCKSENPIHQDGNFIKGPLRCQNPECRREKGFELNIEKSKFIDSQELRVQEKPEDLPPGQLPRYIDVYVEDELVDIVRPGDRISVTGIVKARAEVIPGRGKLRTFLTYIKSNNIEIFGKELETIEISSEDEKKILKVAKSDFVHKDIIESIAPSIYGYDDVKEAIMLLLFSGVPKITYEGVPIRGDVHVLLLGDPGTAKSQMLKYVSKISPRGLYTSGRGTTAAGLTAAVLREKMGGMVLEAGALVLADKGVASVDEIDKMRDEDRVAMHEMMEQQTISVAKGGIIATLNARASILAAGNPKLGRYEDRLSVSENVDIPIVILSRFDLIFIQKDYPQKTIDEKLSEHILNVHKSGGTAIKAPISPDLLKKYITYAKAKIHPKLTEEATKHLRDFYLKMREMSTEGGGSPIAITPRQLEALVRLAEARSRAALREEVTKVDAEAAIRLMQKSLRDVGVMSEAERMDIDVIMTGKPATVREGFATVLKLIGTLSKETGDIELEELYRQLESEYSVDRRTAEDYVRRLVKDGTLYSPKPGYVKKTAP